MFYHKIAVSPGLEEALDAFYRDYANWVRQCARQIRHVSLADAPWQTAIMRSWALLLHQQVKGNEHAELFELLTHMRDKVQLHFKNTGLWKHGYWTGTGILKGTFYFEHCLQILWEIVPDDAATKHSFLQAARHLGNWEPATPAWFNWETGLFYSYFLGTESVCDEPQYRVNVVEQLHLLTMALTAYRMGGDKKFLDLAARYGRLWANALLAREALPIGLGEKGPVYVFNGVFLEAYNAFIGETTTLKDDLERAENFLVHNGIQILLDLWQFTEDPAFRSAARKLLDILVLQLPDPDAGAVAAAIRTYRNLTGSSRYDDQVLQHVECSFPYCVESIAMETAVDRGVRPYGVGKDRFLPVWFENNYPRQHSPILLGLAAEISGNERLAARSLDFARSYFSLARMAFADDRFAGHLPSQSMLAIAAGHSRDNGAGMVTAVLAPLAEVFGT